MQGFSEIFKEGANLLSRNAELLVNLGVSVLGTILSLRVAEHVMRKMTKEGKREKVHILIGRQLVKAFIITGGVTGFLSSQPLMGGYAKTIFAGSSILMAALGFAAQEPIANIINGMFITMYKPFEVGDRIKLRSTGLVGLVEDITLRHTVLRTYENTRVLVPNITISRENIENFNFLETKVCNYIEFRVDPSADIARAREIVAERIKAHKSYIDMRTDEEKEAGRPDVFVYVKNIEGDGVDLRVGVWTESVDASFVMCSDVKQGVLKSFMEEGIALAVQKMQIKTI